MYKTTLSACETALKDFIILSREQETALQLQLKEIEALKEQNDLLKDKSNAWYRDPSITIPLSLLAGGLLGIWAMKQ